MVLLERLNVQGVYYASEKRYKLTGPQPSCNNCGAIHGVGGTVVKNCNAVRRSLHLLGFKLTHFCLTSVLLLVTARVTYASPCSPANVTYLIFLFSARRKIGEFSTSMQSAALHDNDAVGGNTNHIAATPRQPATSPLSFNTYWKTHFSYINSALLLSMRLIC